MYQRYRAVLHVRPLRRLLISSVVGRLPLGTCSLAVLLLVRASTHSYVDAGVCVGALACAEALASPVLGGWLDRLGAVRVISLTAVLQAVALISLALVSGDHPAVWLLILLSGVAGFGMPPVAAAARALWPRLLPEPAEQGAAFSLDAIGQELAWTTGPVIVGLIATAASPKVAMLVVAALTLATSARFIAAVIALELAPREPRTQRGAPPSPITWLLWPVTVLLGMELGGIEVALPAQASYISHASLSGVLIALWSIGSMVGGVAFASRPWRMARERMLALLLLGNGVLVVPLILSHGPISTAVAALITGLCLAPVFSCVSTLIGEHAPAEAIARAFTWNAAATVIGVAAGSALGGAVISAAGVGVGFALAGAAGVLAGVLALHLAVSVPRMQLAVSDGQRESPARAQDVRTPARV